MALAVVGVAWYAKRSVEEIGDGVAGWVDKAVKAAQKGVEDLQADLVNTVITKPVEAVKAAGNDIGAAVGKGADGMYAQGQADAAFADAVLSLPGKLFRDTVDYWGNVFTGR